MHKLKFVYTDRTQFKFDSEQVAVLPSGSRIVKKGLRRGTVHQLWLNEEEYGKLKNSTSNFNIHFYGSNYVYMNEYVKLQDYIEVLVN